MEFHNMQMSDHRYHETIFKNEWKKLNLAEEVPVIGIEGLKTNVFILDQITLNFGRYTGTQLSRNFRIYSISHRD